MIFQNLYEFFHIFLKTLKNERNVTNWGHIIFPEHHFTESLSRRKKNITERNLTELSHSRIVALSKLHNVERPFYESSFSRTSFSRNKICPNAIFPKYNLPERHFPEIQFARTSFSQNCMEPNVISLNTMVSYEYLPCHLKVHKSFVSMTVTITITFWLNSSVLSAQCIFWKMIFG